MVGKSKKCERSAIEIMYGIELLIPIENNQEVENIEPRDECS
jgi:hypothetical protein